MRENIRVWSKKQLAVLEAAEQLFIEYGFENVSVKQISTAAGISSTQIFYYFTNKDILLQQILQWRLEQLQKSMEAATANTALTLQQQLELIIVSYIEQGLHNPLVLAHLFYANVTDAPAGNVPALSELAEKRTVLVRDIIAKAQQEGKVKERINAMQATALISGTVTCMVLNREDFRTSCGLQQLEEAAFNQLLQQTIVGHLHGVLQSIMIYE